MNLTKKYRVNEIFYSLQGEGYFTGTPAVFLRFSGCNLHCPFCDTDFVEYKTLTAEQIVEYVAAFDGRHIVVTGGEPALQIDDELVAALHDAGFFIQIETNGTLPIPEGIDWVTCSPKDVICGRETSSLPGIKRVDELKIVYLGQDVEAIAARFSPKVKYLQPCSGENTREVIDYILAHPWWRLSLQTHKFLNIR